ncbi:MAG TPA: hypothetical protein VIH46_00855 [Candidatus Acidoferrales bacterium]|jgi:hypothetical protein
MIGILPTFTCCCLIVLGAALIVWSAQLSKRYNAWTTGLRERYPRISPPPTPEMRQMNTKIMTWLFRVAGAFFVVFSFFRLFSH